MLKVASMCLFLKAGISYCICTVRTLLLLGIVKKRILGGREMPQGLKMLAPLTEDSSFVPSTHMASNNQV